MSDRFCLIFQHSSLYEGETREKTDLLQAGRREIDGTLHLHPRAFLPAAKRKSLARKGSFLKFAAINIQDVDV